MASGNVLQGCSGKAGRRTPRASAFHGHRPPPISIAAYLFRISKYAKCSPVCFAMAFSYLNRVAQVRNMPVLDIPALNALHVSRPVLQPEGCALLAPVITCWRSSRRC